MLAADGVLRRAASIFLPNEHSLFFPFAFSLCWDDTEMLGTMMAAAQDLNVPRLPFSYFFVIMCQSHIHIWNFLFNGILGGKDFYKWKASQALSDNSGTVGTGKATKEARFIGRANFISLLCFLMLISKQGLVSMKVCPLLFFSFFSWSNGKTSRLCKPCLCNLTLTGSCKNVLKAFLVNSNA